MLTVDLGRRRDANLFRVTEVFERLGQLRETGCLLIYNADQVFQIYFHDGFVVAAKGEGEWGEHVINDALLLVEAAYNWLPDAEAQFIGFKISVQEFLLKFCIHQDETSSNREVAQNITPPAWRKAGVNGSDSTRSRLQVETSRVPKLTSPGDALGQELSKGAVSPRSQNGKENLGRTPSLFYLASESSHQKIYGLFEGANLVGRETTCDIFIPDELHQVSRKHALIQVEGDLVVVKDLSSANGTYLDKNPIEKSVVRPQSIIQFGSHAFVLKKRSTE